MQSICILLLLRVFQDTFIFLFVLFFNNRDIYLCQVLVKMLKPMSLFLIMFILIFGVWANLYMFKIMTWKVWLTGMALPWLGFAFGCTLARLSGRPAEDTIAIAIETGVQNTGVSIFMLWFTFDHPLGDLAGKFQT